MSNIRRSSQENKAIQNLSKCLFCSLSYKVPPFCNHRHCVQTDSSTTYSNITLPLTALGCSLVSTVSSLPVFYLPHLHPSSISQQPETYKQATVTRITSCYYGTTPICSYSQKYNTKLS